MSRDQKRGKQEKGSDVAEKVVVAVKASKEIPKTALVWALTHVVQPGDCITLLVVVSSQSSGNFSLCNCSCPLSTNNLVQFNVVNIFLSVSNLHFNYHFLPLTNFQRG